MLEKQHFWMPLKMMSTTHSPQEKLDQSFASSRGSSSTTSTKKHGKTLLGGCFWDAAAQCLLNGNPLEVSGKDFPQKVSFLPSEPFSQTALLPMKEKKSAKIDIPTSFHKLEQGNTEQREDFSFGKISVSVGKIAVSVGSLSGSFEKDLEFDQN